MFLRLFNKKIPIYSALSDKDLFRIRLNGGTAYVTTCYFAEQNESTLVYMFGRLCFEKLVFSGILRLYPLRLTNRPDGLSFSIAISAGISYAELALAAIPTSSRQNDTGCAPSLQ